MVDPELMKLDQKEAFKAQLKEMLKEHSTVEVKTDTSWYQEDTGWAATHISTNIKIFFDGEEVCETWSGADVPD
jgi:tRNA G46 methylase TrmB